MTAIRNISLLCQYTISDRDAIREDHGTCEMEGCQCSCHRSNKEPDLLAGPLARDPAWLEWLEGQFQNYPEVLLLGKCDEEALPDHLHLDCNVGYYLPAFMGIGTKINSEFAIYDSETIIEIHYNDYLNDPKMVEMARDAAELYDDAREHFSYNISGAYVDGSPMFIDKPSTMKHRSKRKK